MDEAEGRLGNAKLLGRRNLYTYEWGNGESGGRRVELKDAKCKALCL